MITLTYNMFQVGFTARRVLWKLKKTVVMVHTRRVVLPYVIPVNRSTRM